MLKQILQPHNNFKFSETRPSGEQDPQEIELDLDELLYTISEPTIQEEPIVEAVEEAPQPSFKTTESGFSLHQAKLERLMSKMKKLENKSDPIINKKVKVVKEGTNLRLNSEKQKNKEEVRKIDAELNTAIDKYLPSMRQKAIDNNVEFDESNAIETITKAIYKKYPDYESNLVRLESDNFQIKGEIKQNNESNSYRDSEYEKISKVVQDQIDKLRAKYKGSDMEAHDTRLELNNRITTNLAENGFLRFADIEEVLKSNGGNVEEINKYKDNIKSTEAKKIVSDKSEKIVSDLMFGLGEETNDKSEISKVIFSIIKSRVDEFPPEFTETEYFKSMISGNSLSRLLTCIINKSDRYGYTRDSELSGFIYDEGKYSKLINSNAELKSLVERDIQLKTKLLIEKSNQKIEDKWTEESVPMIARAEVDFVENKINSTQREYFGIEEAIEEMGWTERNVTEAKNSISSAEDFQNTLSTENPDINFINGEFKVISKEELFITNLEASKNQEENLENINPELKVAKANLAAENAKRGALGIGGPNKNKVAEYTVAITQEKQKAIANIDSRIQELKEILNNKRQLARNLSQTFRNLPYQFKAGMEKTGDISITEAKNLIGRNIEQVQNYQTPDDLIEGKAKIAELKAKEQEWQTRVKK